MKKQILAIVLVVTCAIGLVSTGCKSFDGYYSDLDKARGESEIYDGCNYLFTKELDDAVVDFIIKDETFNIIEIDIKNAGVNPSYRIKLTSSFILDESIYRFEESNEYNWHNSTKLSQIKYEWCIVTKSFNDVKDALPCFEFKYKGSLYCLCCRFE